MRETIIPRLPVFGWDSLAGARTAGLPSLLDSPDLLLTTSGRAALLLAFERLGIGPGDRVLVPSYHCPTMVSPIVALGASPLFYPIDAQGQPQLDGFGDAALSGVRALLAAHYFALPVDMARLRRWCDIRGVALVEDCAHALFGQAGERAIGQWGDLAIGSLTKFYPVPEGGCLRMGPGTPPPELKPAGCIAQLRSALDILHAGALFGRLRGLNAALCGVFSLRQSLGARRSAPSQEPPMPARADGMEIDSSLARRHITGPTAWVARHLPRERIVQRRRQHYEAFARAFRDVSGLRPLRAELPSKCAPYVFPLWVDDPDPGYQQLRREGIPLSRWNWLWPDVPRNQDDAGILWSHHVLQVPCHQDLSDTEREQLVSRLVAIYGSGARA